MSVGKSGEEIEKLLREGEFVIYSVLSELYYYPPHLKEDLIQEGYCALLDAAERYNPSLGKFPNYARPRVRGRMLNLLEREKKEVEKKKRTNYPLFKRFSALKMELFSSLTEREKKVLSSLLMGFTQKEVAERLNISQPTVSIVLKRIKEKFSHGS